MLIPLQINSCNIRYTKEDKKMKLNNLKLAFSCILWQESFSLLFYLALFSKCSDFWIATGNENIGHLKTLQKVDRSPMIASFFKEHSSYSDSSDRDHYTSKTEPFI